MKKKRCDLECLELGTRNYHAIKRNVSNVAGLKKILLNNPSVVLEWRNVGQITFGKIVNALLEKGFISKSEAETIQSQVFKPIKETKSPQNDKSVCESLFAWRPEGSVYQQIMDETLREIVKQNEQFIIKHMGNG